MYLIATRYGAFCVEPRLNSTRLMKLKWNPIMKNSICIYFWMFEKLMEVKFNQTTSQERAKEMKHVGNQSCNQAIKNESMLMNLYHTRLARRTMSCQLLPDTNSQTDAILRESLRLDEECLTINSRVKIRTKQTTKG